MKIPSLPSSLAGRSLLLAAGLLICRSADADTVINLGSVTQIANPRDLDLTGEMTYAINFSANDPVLTVNGVAFTPDTMPPVGATLVGPQNVAPWQAKPEFGGGTDNNNLEQIYEDIRWCNTGASEVLEAHLAVTAGERYKLQVLFSGNHPEDRRWDIEVEGNLAVDEVSSLGATVGGVIPDYSPNRALVYSTIVTAADTSLDVRFVGDLPGSNNDAPLVDRNAIWQGLTVEHIVGDSDADEMTDAWETLNFGNLTRDGTGDLDSDGLSDLQEFLRDAKPNDSDTDDDGLNDGVEVNTHFSDPKSADTDGDGLTDPNEINTTNTNPNHNDSDLDGLTDGAEVNTHLSDPTKLDTDSDEYDDGFEVAQGSNPANAASFPLFSPQAKAISGGDAGEGLDLTGNFIAAVRFGPPGQFGPWQVRDAEFVPYDSFAGLTEDATTDANDWLLPTFATSPTATQDDINLGEVVDSISYGASIVNITIPGLTIGRPYKVQLLFGEQCCNNRGFDVYLENVLVADEFAPGPVQGGASAAPARAGAVVAAFVAADATLDVRLDFTTITTPGLSDSNAIINAMTVEELPALPDTDTDGLPDAWEITNFGNTSQTPTGDPDADGLNNLAEFQALTDPDDSDTDDDGLNDGSELNTHLTDPKNADTDGDGLNDSAEITTHQTNPRDPDVDNDALTDGAEVNTHLTNPKNIDSDNDGFNDPTEVLNATNPNASASMPGVSHIARVLGGDSQAEGLDLDGTFLYAFNVGTPGAAPGPVRDANFTDDLQPGIVWSATNEIPLWHQVNFGDTENDNNLEFVFQSIRWEAAPLTLTLSLDGLTVGSQYKLQLLFGEMCCPGRGFDLNIEGVTVIDDFHTASTQAAQNHPYAGGAMVHSFTATDSTLDIELNGNTTTFADKNPILSGVTLEALSATQPFAITNIVRTATAGGATIVLSFSGRAGKAYAVDYTTNLATWDEITDSTVAGAGGTGTFTDTLPARTNGVQGNYRLRDPVLQPNP